MSGRLPYGKRYRYPHMIKDEIRVWEKFMDLYPGKFESVDYDFRVGKGSVMPEGFGDNWARMAKMLSQKRIDVIGWVNDNPTIIEIKMRVGLSAMGQVLGYRSLFMKYFRNFPEPKIMIVCETISDDDRDVLEDSKIPIEVVLC